MSSAIVHRRGKGTYADDRATKSPRIGTAAEDTSRSTSPVRGGLAAAARAQVSAKVRFNVPTREGSIAALPSPASVVSSPRRESESAPRARADDQMQPLYAPSGCCEQPMRLENQCVRAMRKLPSPSMWRRHERFRSDESAGASAHDSPVMHPRQAKEQWTPGIRAPSRQQAGRRVEHRHTFMIEPPFFSGREEAYTRDITPAVQFGKHLEDHPSNGACGPWWKEPPVAPFCPTLDLPQLHVKGASPVNASSCAVSIFLASRCWRSSPASEPDGLRPSG